MTQSDLASRGSLGAGPLTTRFDEALLLAARSHRSQLRKGSRIPYLSHLMSVSALVLEHGGTEDEAIAGLLHDAVEDAATGEGPQVLQEIAAAFGDAVAGIVRECSDGLDEAGERSGTWIERKMPYIEGLPRKSPGALLVTAADKTHNARCIASDVAQYGQHFWKTFPNACPHQLAWYYASVRAGVALRLGRPGLERALNEAVRALLEAIPDGREDPGCTCRSTESPRVE